MNFRDVELLSAYLDGRLNPSEAHRLESRLSTDPNLKATFEDLRQTRGLLRKLPQRRAPRNFRLTPKMVGIRPPEPRAYPAFRLATALAAFLFLASVALNALTPFASQHLAAAPAPAYGMGGGGGGGGGGAGNQVDIETETAEAGPFAQSAPAATQAPAATEAPAPTEGPAQPFASIPPTATPEGMLSIAQATPVPPQAQDATRALGLAPSEQANKAAPGQDLLTTRPGQPVPWGWVIGLGVVMLACALGAWVLRRNNERHIRGRWNQK